MELLKISIRNRDIKTSKESRFAETRAYENTSRH
jgi:hypothetical protein